jgi:hypothetical protein
MTTSFRRPGVADLDWTVDQAVRMLQIARPAGLVFLRSLVDEGGTATAARLRERTGFTRFDHAHRTLNASMKRCSVRLTTTTVTSLGPPSTRPSAVYSYSLPPNIVPILDQALRQLGS